MLACLIQLWKFFCWPKQLITLGANSKDQVKFVHYDIMRDLILNSPNLKAIIGNKNIQEKEIRLTDAYGNVRSTIRSISTASGIVSNITGYTFSEVFDMKKPNFFEQLDGSIRGIPNAMGVIDTTVSAKDHFLFKIYTEFILGNTKTVFFSYRQSPKGIPEDWWNPQMDADQLNDYRIKFHVGNGFVRYFQNLWSAGSAHIFTDDQIEEISYAGISGNLLNHFDIVKAIEKKNYYTDVIDSIGARGLTMGVKETREKIEEINKTIKPVSDFYSLIDKYGFSRIPLMEELERLGDVLETYWAILAGADMADPLSIRSGARSILTVVAKGLPGSKRGIVGINEAAPKFIYFLLHLAVAKNKSLDSLKEEAERCHDEFDGIDAFTIEQYYALDLKQWCEERDIACEVVSPVYGRQKEAFNLYFQIVNEGLFKIPPIGILGSKKQDIFREEMQILDANDETKWFGSLEKHEAKGIQDDTQYSTAWTIWGGRNLGVDDLRVRSNALSLGEIHQQTGLYGQY